jgi:hypothetical protein
MTFRPFPVALLAALLPVALMGCQKSAATAPAPTALSPATVASVHWLGKRRLDLAADAYFFSRVWSLPETMRLQAQTFDRLSTGVWRALLGDPAAAQIPAAVLRPLLEDLTLKESYLEIRAATGAPPALVFAIHAGAHTAGIWETNLAIAAQLITHSPAIASPAIHGWNLACTSAPALLRLARVQDWTVISLGPPANALADDLAARIQRDGVPFVSAGTNLWLEAELAPARLAAVAPQLLVPLTGSASLSPPGAVGNFSLLLSAFSHFQLSLTGDGGNVITRGQVRTVAPLPAALPPWQLPVALLHEPMTSFTAVRSLPSCLDRWTAWRALPLGTAPGQVFLWTLAGSPAQAYLAAPLPAAGGSVSALTDWLLQTGNPWLAAHNYISFERAPNGNGVLWGDLPDIKPFIQSAGPGWLYAGLLPDSRDQAAPPPAGMLQDVLRRPDLVYYDWEVTGLRQASCFYLGQTIRQLCHLPPLSPDSASAIWLKSLEPRLRTSATLVTRTGPAELSGYRRSTLGLTAPELQLLAGWLESPTFPKAE